MLRYPDWPERLERFLATAVLRPFRYGSHDCCLFVADAVLAMTGTDLAAEFRGRYASRREALKLTHSYVGRSLQPFLLQALRNLPAVSSSFARRGDIVMLQRSRDYSLGLVSLNGKQILKAAKRGIVCLDFSTAVQAWHV